MNQKVIYSYYSILFLLFLGLVGLSSRFNFSLNHTTAIRDVSDFSTDLGEIAKINLDRKTESVATSFAHPVAPTSTSSTVLDTTSVSRTASFSIKNPAPVSDPSVDAGTGVKRYGSHFLYGHSSLAFSPLKTLYVGDTLTVEINGETKTYAVSRREVFSKASLDANSALRSSIYSANYRGNSYDLALMTCGNGSNDDPTSRLVLFISQV